MKEKEIFSVDKIQKRSKQILNFWKTGAKFWAPKEVSEKLEIARIDWLLDLTDCLNIWYDKNIKMTEGELILAYANLGSLVEGWLKLFYCVYYMHYIENPIKNSKTKKMIEPNKLKLDVLKNFSRDNLWQIDELEKKLDGQFINYYLLERNAMERDKWIKWIEKIQQRRNAIHSFNNREIGTPTEYLDDINIFADFIDFIDSRLPHP